MLLATRRPALTLSRYDSQLLNLLLFFPSVLVSIQKNDNAYMKAQRAKG